MSNPNAPAVYDANLKNGDLAVAAMSDSRDLLKCLKCGTRLTTKNKKITNNIL